jgi:hypothetical protein
MKTLWFSMFTLVLATGCTTAPQLTLKPERRSTHLGESLDCTLSYTPDYEAEVKRSNELSKGIGNYVRFTWNPACIGTNTIGPVEMTCNGKRLKSDVAQVIVLPEKGTNNFFEIRIFDNEIRMNQKVEVVFQMQSQADDRDKYKDLMRRHEFIADWVVDNVSSRYWTCSGHFGMMEVYTLTPRRAGTFLITREFFQNLPNSYPFTAKKIIVRE